MALVRQGHKGVNRRGIGRIKNHGGWSLIEGNRGWWGDSVGLHVCRITTIGANEGVLPHVGGVQELFTARPTHRARIGLDNYILKPQALEDSLVGVSLSLIRLLQTLIGVIKGVGVLHRELSAAQQTRAWAGLIAIFILDLINHQGQIFVTGEEIFDRQGKDFFVGWRQKILRPFAVLEAENAISILVPTPRCFVGLLGQ